MSRRILFVSQPIVGDNGTMSQQFQEWQTLVTRLLPLTGTGSPEGVEISDQFQHYYDTAGASGSILYIKMVDDIGGDKSLGWKLA